MKNKSITRIILLMSALIFSFTAPLVLNNQPQINKVVYADSNAAQDNNQSSADTQNETDRNATNDEQSAVARAYVDRSSVDTDSTSDLFTKFTNDNFYAMFCAAIILIAIIVSFFLPERELDEESSDSQNKKAKELL